MSIEEKVRMLEEHKRKLQAGGGEERIEKQHKAGKLTARERVAALVDPDSFEEVLLFAEHR